MHSVVIVIFPERLIMWILFVTVVAYSGVSITSANFETQKACEKAAAILTDKNARISTAICVKKD